MSDNSKVVMHFYAPVNNVVGSIGGDVEIHPSRIDKRREYLLEVKRLAKKAANETVIQKVNEALKELQALIPSITKVDQEDLVVWPATLSIYCRVGEYIQLDTTELNDISSFSATKSGDLAGFLGACEVTFVVEYLSVGNVQRGYLKRSA